MGTPPGSQPQIPPQNYYCAPLHQQYSSYHVAVPNDYLYQQRSQEQYFNYQSAPYESCFASSSSRNREIALDSQIGTLGDEVASISSITSDSISGKSESTTLVALKDDGASACVPLTEAREKSKKAARTRRMNENTEYERLAQVLLLPATIKVMLDKASILRLTINFIKMRHSFSSNEENTLPNGPRQSPLSNIMLEALDGFPLILSDSGTITYIGETVKTLLGLAKWDLTETSFAEYVKEGEQEELGNLLRLTSSELNQINCFNTEFLFERRFTIRVKCILSKRNSGLNSEGYKTLHYGGYITAMMLDGKEGPKKVVQRLSGIASTLPAVNRNSTEIRMGQDMFMFRASLDLKITYADDQLQFLTGYQARDVIDTSLYQLVHVGDAEELAECHKILLAKGQVITRYFRLLCKYGGWVWAQTQATILRNTRGSKSDCVIGVTYVLTKIQASSMKFEMKQLQVDSFGTSDYGRTLISKPTNSFRRKRSYPLQNAPQMGTLQPFNDFASKAPIFNANFNENFSGGVESGGGKVRYISFDSSASYQPPPQPNHAGLISDAYANQSGFVVQHSTGIPVPALNVMTTEEIPYYGVSFSDASVLSTSIPSSIGTNSYLEQLRSHQADANCNEYWQDAGFYYQS
ncbi:hypothetical protein TcWFU_000754 [Taenia crassiceps]|uniref:Uncharacterized protein n=1 Tax=Taenia crassiceps TaxID=6207 RepID=A0ABR4Q9B4_9CEST